MLVFISIWYRDHLNSGLPRLYEVEQWTALHVVFKLRHVPIPSENAALQLRDLTAKILILFAKGSLFLAQCSFPLLVILLHHPNDLLQLWDGRLSQRCSLGFKLQL
jgi:hypothetical protein